MQKLTKRFAIWAISLAILASSSPGSAQDLPSLEEISSPCAPDVPKALRGGLTTVEVGDRSIRARWFHMDVARCMLGRLSSLPLYAQRVSLLSERLTLGTERLALEARRADLAVEGEEQAVQALEAAERGRRAAEEARSAWYRKPAFLVTMGAVAVIVLEAIAVGVLYKLGTF